MRKIILSTPMTLDGFIEGPNRELDWVIADDELHDYYADLLESADLLIYGRVTYELMRNYWPNASSDPSATASEIHFANTVNPKHKIVFSKTLKNVDWNSEVRSEINPKEIIALKAQAGKSILISGASIASQFLSNGWVDEIRPVIMPVAISEGKPLFGNLDRGLELKLSWAKTFHSGALALCYTLDGKINH